MKFFFSFFIKQVQFFTFVLSGTTANDVHFQAFLLEGLHCWNWDRQQAAVMSQDCAKTYDSTLMSAVNKLHNAILGVELSSTYTEPRKYTVNSCIFYLVLSIYFLLVFYFFKVSSSV